MKRTFFFASCLVLGLAVPGCQKSRPQPQEQSAQEQSGFQWQFMGTSMNAYGCWANIHGSTLPTPSEAIGLLKEMDDDRPETCPKPMPLHFTVRVPSARSPSLCVQNFPDARGPKIYFSGVSVPNASDAEAWESKFCGADGVTCLTRGMTKDEIYRYGHYKTSDLDPETPRPTG
jgi:hypothetical protein